MKQTMKKCLTLLLALALLFTMAVPAAAAPATYNKEITFTNVAQGDTVKAYKLMWYSDDYNSYQYYEGFSNFAGKNYVHPPKTLDDVLAESTPQFLTTLMSMYVLMTESPLGGGATLPDVQASAKAGADEQAKLTLNPGYYLLLVSTTEQNNRTYMPVTVFVQVKNGNVRVYAAGSEITDGLTAVFKHEEGPAINVRVNDDSRDIDEWKETAGGRVGETMDFYMEVSTPAYESEHVTISSLIAKCQLAGLNYVADSMKATTLPNADSGAVEGAIKGTTVGADGNLTVELDYSKIRNAATGRGLIYLHFQATVAPDAVAESEASATAKLEYVFSMEAGNTKTTADSTAAVYNYNFTLFKKSNELNNPDDAGSGHRPLAGAGFTLYSDNAMKTPVSMVKVDATATTEAYYRPALAGETGETVLLADMGDDQNTLLVRGLDAATYYLKETEVPSGYYAPKGGFEVKLTGERDVNVLNGKLAAASSFTATNPETDRVLINSSVLNGTEQNRLDASLKNSSTPVLPTTGGVGTVMFTVVGLLCMGAALWFFLFARRRRKDEQEQG